MLTILQSKNHLSSPIFFIHQPIFSTLQQKLLHFAPEFLHLSASSFFFYTKFSSAISSSTHASNSATKSHSQIKPLKLTANSSLHLHRKNLHSSLSSSPSRIRTLHLNQRFSTFIFRIECSLLKD